MTTTPSATSWQCLVAFPDESASFVYGFEAGMIWEYLQRGETVLESVVHEANREVLQRMALASGYVADWAESFDEEWVQVCFRRKGDPPAYSNPHGLHIVEREKV